MNINKRNLLDNNFKLYKTNGIIDVYINGDIIIEINNHLEDATLRTKIDDNNSLYICEVEKMQDIYDNVNFKPNYIRDINKD